MKKVKLSSIGRLLQSNEQAEQKLIGSGLIRVGWTRIAEIGSAAYGVINISNIFWSTNSSPLRLYLTSNNAVLNIQVLHRSGSLISKLRYVKSGEKYYLEMYTTSTNYMHFNLSAYSGIKLDNLLPEGYIPEGLTAVEIVLG